MAPARVVRVDGSSCDVATGARIDRVSMLLDPDLQVGDWVLVNSGAVVRKLDAGQAADMSRAFAIVFGTTDAGADPGAASGADHGEDAATDRVAARDTLSS